MLRIPFDDLRHAIEQALLRLGLDPDRAALSARLTAETDRDGVQTHGIARLPRFAKMVRLGRIDPRAQPERLAGCGALERWTGHRGPGNLAAHAAMQRAMELATQHGLGAVALADTTHWQRGGAFGWQAADAGFAALCWTNTLPNVPAWGAATPSVGNNPLVFAIPHATPHAVPHATPHAIPRAARDASSAPIVLDMAMSQYSYGTIEKYRKRGELLPFAGGYDEAGELTRDPAAIEGTQRALPIGLWKGSGLAFALDVLAAMLSGGRATHEFATDPLLEAGQSQVFLAIAPSSIASFQELNAVADAAIAALHDATPIDPRQPVRYPGEGALAARAESLRLGVAVDEQQWNAVLHLAE